MPISLVAKNSNTPEEEQQKMLQQLNQSKARQGQPQVNLPQQKGPLSQFREMATNQVMSDAIDAGTNKLYSKGASMLAGNAAPAVTAGQSAAMQSAVGSGMLNPAIASSVGAGTAGAGAMAGLGAAVPYIGAGLLAGKAFGLFNKGGAVYASGGYNFSDKGKVSRKKEIEDYYNDESNIGIDKLLDPMGDFFDPFSDYMNQTEEYKSEGGDIPMPANLRKEMNKKARDYASFNYGIMDDGSFEGKKAAQEETIKDLKTNHPKAIKRLMSEYKDDGGLIGPLALRKIKYKQDGGKIELELSGE